MILVKSNSAHYNTQQQYLNYLRNIKVGDFYQLIMFEGYDISDGYFSDNYLKSLGLK